ncbi:MAG: phosphoenolpyruvate synthase regulatory protein [Thermobacillus sp. ZCTH02-B1]|uniref:pyruvate, water dikinase regulatory protein n=1 Tax=Thermobacillus sp. ZCTH02-B1 TaxID=1858795 RepID=UPI000B558AFF|nr:pyruvate, water dikinase regulatory protein [Thermobacillus sp. ZCTH02-B1]OUM94607.1 MAG: phosphoenolpyruvate synthase regulatory protein [Thermobacillus sp. ZCTH02-B1]
MTETENGKRPKTIFICSDGVGETAEAVAKATVRQFDDRDVRLKRYAPIKDEDEIAAIVEEAARTGAFIAFTLVQPELREMMREEAGRRGVRAVDVLGPMMQAYIDTFNGSPRSEPGLLHQLDEDYFRRIEAVEFAIRFDDGKDVRGLLQAEVILIGVSRTSKTPLSVFLAHKGIRTANLPLVPEVRPPAELMENPADALIVGLTMDPDRLREIRGERLREMGLPGGVSYASGERIREELAYARSVMEALGCPVIDVTYRSIEETAAIIMRMMHEAQEKRQNR